MTKYPSEIKKCILCGILLGICIFSASNIYAISTETKEQITKSMEGITKYWNRLSPEKRQSSYEWFLTAIKSNSATSNTDKQELIAYIEAYMQWKMTTTTIKTSSEKVKTNNATTKISNEEDINYIPKVDFQKVQEAWLARHNEERENVGVEYYNISLELNTTAKEWAQYLAKRNGSTHKRKSTDGYYNYDSIKEWFSDRWITFPKEKLWIANFSENIAYQYYKCNKEDCTQDLINALKKWFNFFMSEKKYNWAHYRAVTSKYFTNMGMGVWIVGSRYYIVTHYTTEIED